MYAVIGRVKIKPGQAEETLAMIGDHGEVMLRGMTGSNGCYWARTVHGEDLIQHPFVVRHRGTRQVAEVTFNSLGDMPEAPAVYVSVGVCGVVGEA